MWKWKCIYAPGCSLGFLLWPVIVSFYPTLYWGSSWCFSHWRRACSTSFLELLHFPMLAICLVLEMQVCCSWQLVSCQLYLLRADVMPCTTVVHPSKVFIFQAVWDMQWFKNKQNTQKNPTPKHKIQPPPYLHCSLFHLWLGCIHFD